MSFDDLSFPALLDRLPVPEHGADFWSDLEARLVETPVDPAVGGSGAAHLRSVDTELDDQTVTELDRRRRARRLSLVLGAAAAAVVAAIVGLQLFDDDDDPPTITDTPSTTSIPGDADEDSAPPPDGGGPVTTEALDWSGLGPGGGPDIPSGQGASIAWVGSQFATFNFDGDRPPIELSTDGRTWVALEGLPDGFEPRSIAGWHDSLVVGGLSSPEPGQSSPALVALSADRGESWELLPSAGPAAPTSPYLTYRTEPGGMAVIGDTVLLSAIINAQVDLTSALDDAGTPLLGGVWAELSWTDGEWWATVCEEIAVGAGCTPEPRHRLADLGIDPNEMPVGRGENWAPQTAAFYRSVGGGPFEALDLDLAIGDLMQVQVVADQFVISTSTFTYDDDGAAARGPSRLWRSVDGMEWTSSELELDPSTTPLLGLEPPFVATDDTLFALRDGQPIRSLDVGRTWDALATPGDVEVHGIFAGPAGALLLGRMPVAPFEYPDEIVKDGYSITLEAGITIRDPSGEVIVMLGDPTFEPPAGAPALEPIEDGPVFYELRDPATGAVVLEILDTEVRDLGGLRSGDDCASGPQEFIAWSPDGTSFEWQPAGEAFGGDATQEVNSQSVAIGATTAIAWVNRPGPARAADFRDVTDFEPDTSPIEGQATVCHGTEGTYEAFIADLD